MKVHPRSITPKPYPALAAAAVAIGTWLTLAAPPVSAATGPAVSHTFTVNSTADSHDANPGDGVCADSQSRCTLRAAIEEASAEPSGSTVSIHVPAGTYRLSLGSLKASANTLTVAGAGAATTVIKGNGTFGVLRIGKSVTATLTGVTITGGNAGNSGYGGGVLTSGHTTVSHAAITANTAVAGGGITNAGGTLTISDSTVSGNQATAYGGGGIQNGGLKNSAGTVSVVSSTVSNNIASGDGGGILNGQNGHPATARASAVAPRSRLAALTASRRPAAGTQALTPPHPVRLNVTNSTITSNTSDNAGGAIANDGGTTTVTGSTISSNTCPNAIGGGIETYGPLTVTRSTLSGNSAAGGYGGGIETYSGGVTGITAISQSTLSRNSATIGGAIDDSNTVDITQSTLSANHADQAGGGVEVEGATVSVVNSTLAANTAGLAGSGGGIETYACGAGTVLYSTLSGNSTALSLSCPDVTLTGTIVAASTSGTNCAGAAPSETYGYNLDSGTSCGFSKPTDLNSASPLLGPLANNGGPTETELPQPGSPVINAGGQAANGCPPTDQRGDRRPFGPACDIGSVEAQG